MNKPRRFSVDFYWCAGLFFLALALRLIYLWQIKSNPFFYDLTLDPLFHHLWAKSIAAGDWLGSGIYFRAPFYPYFLGVLYKLFGLDLLLVRLIQHMIGSLAVVLVYRLALELFDRRVAVLSGILAATYWMLIYFEGELLLDTLLVFLNFCLLLLLYRASSSPSFGKWLLAGIVLGASAITRPNILLFLPILLLALWTYYGKTRPPSFCVKSWLAVFFGALLIILPVTARNLVVGGDLVLVASQGGINFYIGNNPYSDGSSAVVPGLGDDWDYADAVALAEAKLGKRLKPSEASNYYYKLGRDFILKEPGKAFRLLLKKFYLFWNHIEIGNNQNVYFFQRYSSLLRILPIGFWLIGPLSILGFFLAVREFRKYSILLGLLVSYAATVVMFFVNDRFRLPLIPIFIILAAHGLVSLWNLVKARSFAKMGISLTVLAIAILFCNSNWTGLSKTNFGQSYFSLGNLNLRDNKLDEAVACYDTALGHNPNLPRARLNLGIVYLRQGKIDSAGAEFARTLALNPYEEKAYNNLSTVYRLKGDFAKAVRFAQGAVDLRPNYGTAYLNLALAYQAQGQLSSAEHALHTGIATLSRDLQLHYSLGELYLKEEKKDEAQSEFESVLGLSSRIDIESYDISVFWQSQTQSPDRLKALAAYNLGLLWAERGRLDLAEAYFRDALTLKPDLAEALANLGKIEELKGENRKALDFYSQAIKLDPRNHLYYYNRATVNLKIGDVELTEGDLKIALAIRPDFVPAQKLLARLKK